MKEQLASLKLKSQRRKDGEEERKVDMFGKRPPRNPLSKANRSEIQNKYGQQREDEEVKIS